jgi:hypothetical protein
VVGGGVGKADGEREMLGELVDAEVEAGEDVGDLDGDFVAGGGV